MSWSGIESLPVGHTAVGLLADDREVDIYRVSDSCIWDVTTALPVEPVSWKRVMFHTALRPKTFPQLLLDN